MEIHNNNKFGDHYYEKDDNNFTAIGMLSPPSKDEFAAEMAEYAQTVGA